MKKILQTYIILILALQLGAQDTITVQTFDWPSESRDSVFQFPDPSEGPFRKIIMEYGMRCHDLLVGNLDVGCREWDYSCNTVIYDSSRVDSSLVDDGQGGLIYQTSSPVRYEIMSFVTPYGNGLDLVDQLSISIRNDLFKKLSRAFKFRKNNWPKRQHSPDDSNKNTRQANGKRLYLNPDAESPSKIANPFS